MIWESSEWKEPLLKSATWLRRIRLSESTKESTYVKIEKELFFGFYSVRKLLDTVKVSDQTKKAVFPVRWYKNIEPVNSLNWHKIDQLFDLDNSHSEERKIRFICDRFIHSYVFMTCEKEGRLDGVFVASDKDKQKKLYYVSLDVVLKIFRLVGNDYPSKMSTFIDPETGEETIFVG